MARLARVRFHQVETPSGGFYDENRRSGGLSIAPLFRLSPMGKTSSGPLPRMDGPKCSNQNQVVGPHGTIEDMVQVIFRVEMGGVTLPETTSANRAKGEQSQ